MREFDNERDRYGSAGFVDVDDRALYTFHIKTPDSAFIGFDEKGRPLYWSGMGGLLTLAGARSGKLTKLIAYNILDGMCAQNLILLDPKGEIAAISQLQIELLKYCYYWNPLYLHGLPGHKTNPVDFIRLDSPSLVADIKVFLKALITVSGSSNADYFEKRAREFVEAIILTLVHLEGTLTLPRLYDVINLIPMNNEAWLDFAFEMTEVTGYEIPSRIEAEIAASRDNESGGFRGILGEIFKAFAPLSDPMLMASVSPPFDFSFADLLDANRRFNMYLMPPLELIGEWASILKAILASAFIYKSRSPSAPRQTWILDEVPQLHGFDLAVKLYSIGAGMGIRPWGFGQTGSQLNKLAPNAQTEITASAAVQHYFGIRDLPTAEVLSRMLGSVTLEYDDAMQQARAERARKEALYNMFLGQDPVSAGLEYSYQNQVAQHRTKTKRALRTPDEILNTPNDRIYMMADGLPHPAEVYGRPYYGERALAGKFHPNPYHPPADRVQVQTMWGTRWRKVTNKPIPDRYADLPQYAYGKWSYIEGYKP